jgi:molybdopterin converting factor small subunit
VPITVRIPPPLRRFTGGVEAVQFSAVHLSDLFEGLEQKFPGIKQSLCASDGTPQRFLNIYVNDEDIRFLGGMKYTFQEGDEILLIPAIAGGAPNLTVCSQAVAIEKSWACPSRCRV